MLVTLNCYGVPIPRRPLRSAARGILGGLGITLARLAAGVAIGGLGCWAVGASRTAPNRDLRLWLVAATPPGR